jgi:hypothetical protein
MTGTQDKRHDPLPQRQNRCVGLTAELPEEWIEALLSAKGKAEKLTLSERDALHDNLSAPPERLIHAAQHGLAAGSALVSAFEASPHRDIDIEPARAPMPVRGSE